jgi:hypothetical protein
VPAIQPARLKQQAVLVAGHFDNPPAFLRSLHHLLEFYAERAKRPGQSGKPGPQISAYQVRPPVIRQLLKEIQPLAENNPEKGLALCDTLWDENILEFRTMSAMLLGKIPIPPSEPILNRIQKWIKPELEIYLIDALITNGLLTLREEEPQTVTRLAKGWLMNEDNFSNLLGLRVIITMIEDPEFDNIPIIFRMIQPMTRQVKPALRQDLLDVLSDLAIRSPKETAFFLRQTIDIPSATDAPWLIRQTLSSFPDDLQENLREALRSKGESAREY